jgi:secondary thiamine-phosphate synthase enzyme
MVHTERVTIETRGENDLHNLTDRVSDAIRSSGLEAGIVTVFVAHSTAAITISEYERGLIEDVRRPLERIAPADEGYLHNRLNADDNAHSHLLSSIIGPSVTVPFSDGSLLLGAWQGITLLELDTHPRRRQVIFQVIGA